MPCYRPLEGWVSRTPGRHGGFGIVFDPRNSNGQRMVVPCGSCIGCRLARSKDWAVRCTHEQQTCGDSSCFITLTYNDAHLPWGGSLEPSHFTKFMKRLRKKYPELSIRYFMCGEYGARLQRPHYHAILFGIDFSHDRYIWREQAGKERLYRSPTLETLWPFGYSSIGDCTWQSAAYVARYVLKKVNGDEAEDHYYRPDERTGELISTVPEYVRMSRGRGDTRGLGHEWFQRFYKDIYPEDFVVTAAGKTRPPRYYDELLRVEDPRLYQSVKRERRKRAIAIAGDPKRPSLEQQEECKALQIDRLTREYEIA